MNKHDINYLLKHSSGPYGKSISDTENDLNTLVQKNTPKRIDDLGLSDRKYWDFDNDRKLLQEDALIVAECTNIDNSTAKINM